MTEKTNPLIVALDTPKLSEAEKLLKQLQGIVSYYKIGFESFTALGWQAVELVMKFNARVFLDLKLHDIPNTVRKTAAVICRHQVDMFNVHALGGLEMMQTARKAVDDSCMQGYKKPAVIAVTILTSQKEEALSKELGIGKALREEVMDLAALAKEAGLDGVVSSPQETAQLRTKFTDDFLIVTPGIRMPGSDRGDQQRINTPQEAIKAGASYLVVGRPITAAPDPAEAAKAILKGIT